MAKAVSKSEIELYVINRVREIRIHQKISQADLAIKLDLSVGFIGHVESPNHRAKYNLNHINKLAKIFDCPFQDFFPSTPFESSI
ncbi:transcriptional regulator with XRE-family HTH domain [Pedobacter cryoconitis]|uniref:helix-turn-helix domain-containing protein n=1 Tax=Pedobacter cryoconitis TaxID=188932 RepID=UPI00161CE5AC|nr:helix-turn-helix transcriptional regulator [Pedobacter cryoconitis]MBB6273144.1 transcriptional regulator with XRE-family HTH domain [Pedobacter cryoconitis]